MHYYLRLTTRLTVISAICACSLIILVYEIGVQVERRSYESETHILNECANQSVQEIHSKAPKKDMPTPNAPSKVQDNPPSSLSSTPLSLSSSSIS
jgi:hypothetical protein